MTNENWTDDFQELYPNDNPTPQMIGDGFKHLNESGHKKTEVLKMMCLANHNLKPDKFKSVLKQNPTIGELIEYAADLVEQDAIRIMNSEDIIGVDLTKEEFRPLIYRIHSVRTLLYWADREKEHAEKAASAAKAFLSSYNINPESMGAQTRKQNADNIRSIHSLNPYIGDCNLHRQAVITLIRVIEETQADLDVIETFDGNYQKNGMNAAEHAHLAEMNTLSKMLRMSEEKQ